MKRQEREAAVSQSTATSSPPLQNKEQTQVAQANARVGATSNPNTGTPSTENEIRNVVHGIPDPRQVEDSEKGVLLDEALAVLAKLGYTGLTEEDLGKLNKTDEYDEELHLMAEVRAYFQVAYKVRSFRTRVHSTLSSLECSE